MTIASEAQDVRQRLRRGGRWVVKIGSALTTSDGRGVNSAAIEAWADQFVALRAFNIDTTIVTSGAVAEGVARLNWPGRPHLLHELQAAAAVGQMGLVRTYELAFQRHAIATAQILLTHDDLASRERYLNARAALLTLLEMGVFPVINENDTVATDEIKFGDNDTLAGLVSNLLEADLLLILTDQDGLFDADPRHNPEARLIHEAHAGDAALMDMAGEGGLLGRGGMITKVRAAALAARSGTPTIIASGRDASVITRLAEGVREGTLLLPTSGKLAARKQWLAGISRTQGRLLLDDGAVKVIIEQGRSLLPVGVRQVVGQFPRGSLVSCCDLNGHEVARGLVNYGSDDVRKIAGQPSARIEELLGYAQEPELIHRNNMVLVHSPVPAGR
ncbi:MAG: glutamate 5-kinase [Gammaproteobacteria bacterium]|nr:glutamate 5-kinase [Gammaproteobacteria bacterium]